MCLGYNGSTSFYSSLQDDIAYVSGSGFEYLEIRDYKLEEFLKTGSLSSLKDIFCTKGIKPLSVNTLEDINFRSKEDHHSLFKKLDWLGKCTEAIGCPYIVVAPCVRNLGLSWDEIKNECVRVLRELSYAAGRYSMKLGFEFVGLPYATVSNLIQALEIVEQVNRDNVGLVMDTSAFYCDNLGIDCIKKIPLEKLYMVHINDVEQVNLQEVTLNSRVFPGEGVLPLGKILDELKNIKYKGPFSIELFREEVWKWEMSRIIKRSFESSFELLEAYLRKDKKL